ncbi:MAG TPA: TetR/AcrR family transcriptional regulator [Gaiellales bacterium]|jgi:AcrR family transcriptional regulator|nr:TetR/AcrR family transcriptional regulator [Gaiellales bacterium]
MKNDDETPRRAYRSDRRREQAQETRRRMLDAAGTLLGERGYAGTTIAAVAAEAGVAVETVYAAFRNKRTLVGELVRTSVRGDGSAPPAAVQAGARAVAAAPTQAQQVRLFAADVSARLERVGPVLQALAAAPDPELAELRANVDRDRLAGMRMFVAALERRGPLRVDVESAAETVWALASPELHSLVRGRREWPPQRYSAWLGETLAATLLGPGADEVSGPGPSEH